MNRTDRSRLDDLRDRAELDILEIDNRKTTDLLDLTTQELTIGQIIRLADLVNAVDDLQRAVKGAPSTSTGVETRYSGEAEQSAAAAKADALAKLFQDQLVQTVNGPVPWSDIPVDEDGIIPNSWVDENCPCAEHAKKRTEKESRAGNYL